MPVIINDFEIVLEPKPSTRDAQSDVQDRTRSAATPPLRPSDIEQMIRRLAQRRQRLCAD
jgi:hypothetical protein